MNKVLFRLGVQDDPVALLNVISDANFVVLGDLADLLLLFES